MIKNCLAYNRKDTIFYRAGMKMKEQGAAVIEQVRQDYSTIFVIIIFFFSFIYFYLCLIFLFRKMSSRFSGALQLTNLDDFITPSQVNQKIGNLLIYTCMLIFLLIIILFS